MVYVVSGSMYEYDRRPFVFAHVITHSVSVPFFWRKARNSRAWPADLVVKIGTTTTRPSADRYDMIKLELVSFQFQFQSTARTLPSIPSSCTHAPTAAWRVRRYWILDATGSSSSPNPASGHAHGNCSAATRGGPDHACTHAHAGWIS